MTKGDPLPVQIFLSYAREDRGLAKELAGRLEAEGFSVWWDFTLIGGQDYRSEIADAIARAEHVVVLWSEASVNSHFVIDEASLAKKQGKLVPVLTADVAPPLGFGGLHTVTCRNPETDAAVVVAALKFRPSPPRQPNRRVHRRFFVGGVASLAAAGAGIAAMGGWDWMRNRLSHLGGTGRDSFGAPVQRLALVVGNNAYQNVAPLANPLNDANAIGRKLAESGFNVALLADSNSDDFQEAIRQFKILLSLGGVGVFYYAGHAAHIAGRDFVLPVDAPDVRTAEAFVQHSIEITEMRAPIRTFFSGLQTRVRYAGIQLIPPSRDGTPERSEAPGWNNLREVEAAEPELESAEPGREKPAPAERPAMPKRIQADHGVMTVYSAGRGEVAFDGHGSHSPFAEALLEEIGNGDGDVVRVARRVRAKVRDLTDEMQNPVLEDETTREFYFNAPERDPRDGLMRLVFLDSCRDNPYAARPDLLSR